MRSDRSEAGAAENPRPAPLAAKGEREPGRLSRKQRDFRRHQRDTLQAAERLLFEHSYQDITVQQIAQEAEFSIGYIYKLFPNKEEIFASVIRERHREMFELIEQGLKMPTPVPERFHSLLVRLFEWIDEHMAYTASSWRDLSYLFKQNAELHEEVNRRDREIRDRFTELFAEGIRIGYLAAEDPQTIALVFRAVLWGLVRTRLTEGTQEQDTTRLAALTMRVITRTFAPDGLEN
ncbi:MAG: TetR/AcrR family transcriptional regulator [Candidatus Eisenbacteria sp.]|nr:TetR/AcrR family transcriptional regulator [Candidatus Eisenbacteria bacterium]